MNTSAGSGGPPRGPQFDNRRVVAGLIDLVAVAAVAIVVGMVAGFIAGPGTEASGAMPVLVLAWALFYYFALESGNGQTLGKRIMGLRVLAVDGQPAGIGAVGARTVLRIIDGIGLYLVGLIAMIATGQRRQRLGDLAGKTIVTSADWKPSAAGQPTAAAAAPATSAIVLPTAAGPELPTSTIPSPFTPLAADPSPEPQSTVPEPPSVTPDMPTVAADLPSVSAEPPSVTPEPPTATPDAPIVAAEPPSVTVDPPGAMADLPGVTADALEVAPAPPPWNPQPAAATPDPPDVSVPSPFEMPAADSSPATDPIVDGPADGTWEPVPEPEVEAVAPDQLVSMNGSAASEPTPVDEADEYDEDEPVRVRSVETMSAMDLLMSELEEDEPAGHRPAS